MGRFIRFLAALFGLGLLLAVVEFLPIPDDTYFWDRTYDTGHILIFGFGTTMALIMAHAFLGSHRKRWQYGVACLSMLVLGVAVEIWQSYHDRSAEWIDVYNDLIGILAFALLGLIFDGRIPTPRTNGLRRDVLTLLLLGVLLLGLAPYYQVIRMYHVRRTILPSLVDWQEPWYSRFYYVQSADFEVIDVPKTWPEEARQTSHAAHVRLSAERQQYPGFVCHEPYPDWSDFTALIMDVELRSATPMKFVFRAHDLLHNHDVRDRCSTELRLQPGHQRLRFDLAEMVQTRNGRTMDITQMRSFALFTFTDQIQAPCSLVIGKIQLVP